MTVPRLPLANSGPTCERHSHLRAFLRRGDVTTFTARQKTPCPIWMLSERLAHSRQRPITNVVAWFVIAVTLVPIPVDCGTARGTENVAGHGKQADLI